MPLSRGATVIAGCTVRRALPALQRWHAGGVDEQLTLEELAARAHALSDDPVPRRLLGIAGAPGSGKSTLAAALADALGPELAVVVSMNGFHLAQAELE